MLTLPASLAKALPMVDKKRNSWPAKIKRTFTSVLPVSKNRKGKCINCGACFLSCLISNYIGLGTFGSKIARGPIGIVKTAFIKGVEEAVKAGLYVCAQCKQCTETCPSGINTYDLNQKVREKAVQQGFILPEHEEIIKNIKEKDNPFGKKLEDKMKWHKSE